MIRISATDLESFRLACTADIPNKEEELIAKITGAKWEPSWQALGGIAWHKCLEKKDHVSRLADNVELVKMDGFVFILDDIYAAQNYIGPGTWEVKTLLKIGNDINVVCKGDHLRGVCCQDNKTKWSPVDLSDYDQSLQWRLYLDAFHCSVFRYNCFDFKPPKNPGDVCILKDILSTRYYPYPGMREECYAWVTRFLDWAEMHGLMCYLQGPGGSPTHN